MGTRDHSRAVLDRQCSDDAFDIWETDVVEEVELVGTFDYVADDACLIHNEASDI